MGDREIVDAAQVGAVLAVFSGAALVVSTVLMILGRLKARQDWVRTALICAVGILAWPLWMIYNGIEDHFGLDSVAALLLNLALFVAVGVGGGFALRRLWSAPLDTQHGDTETQRLAQRGTEG